MESLYALKIKSQNPVNFSPQQLVDCSTSYGNYGCSGGLFQPSVKYFTAQSGKIATLASYPYTAKQGSCKTTGLNQVNLGTIKYTDITQGDEKGLADALVKYGPMFIGLHVSDDAFMFYKSGVVKINNCKNGRGDMEHALALVGYGYDNSLKLSYWIIKNSWGADWGENGYVRLAKDAGNMCGVTTLASWATLS
jgi:C1A family cysteine protease